MQTYKPTQAVINNHQRAKALANKQNKKVNNVIKGLRLSAIDLDSELSLDDVKKLYTNFQQIEKKVDLKKALTNNEAPSSTIGWYYLGGQAGLAWCRSILKQENVVKSYKKDITEDDLNLEGESRWNKTKVVKSLNEELMQVTYVAMQEGVDAHGDYVSEDEVRKAKENFNKSMMRANLFHLVMTDSFEIIESYLAPVDMVIGEYEVRKGTWLTTLQVYDEELWNLIKSGEINGVSIGGRATVEELE